MDAGGEENSRYLASCEILSRQDLYVHLIFLFAVERGCADSGIDFTVYNAVGVFLVTGARDAPGFTAW